jgi:hypothetical protein
VSQEDTSRKDFLPPAATGRGFEQPDLHTYVAFRDRFGGISQPVRIAAESPAPEIELLATTTKPGNSEIS